MKNATKISVWLFTIIGLVIMNSCGTVKSDSNNGRYVGSDSILTTLHRTIIPDVVRVLHRANMKDTIKEFSKFRQLGYGKYHYGPGLPYQKRLDLMPLDYSPTVKNKAKLLRFFAMTDIHLTDKESPAQSIYFAPEANDNAISCYAPLMLYTTQVLNAAVMTINAIHKRNPIDFGISLGDMANSTQYNELRWFINILDGGEINPDSGTKDDPIPGPNNDYQDKFTAPGLDRSIHWYATLGNHDHFWMGSKPVNAKISAAMTGTKILQIGDLFKDPTNWAKDTTYSVGTLDCSTIEGKIIGSGPVATLGNIPAVAPDSLRRSLTKVQFMSEFTKTKSFPIGHGFIQVNPLNQCGGCYSFEPKSNLPIKVIVLDDTQFDEDTPRAPWKIYGNGSLEHGRYEWLINQLKAGQDENKLMIIAAHVPIGVAPGTSLGWYNDSIEKVTIDTLHKFPNLILWIAGHRHLNNVTPFPSTDAAHPENGFWEVETKSLREFPQQFRTFDIIRNSDNTISIFTTNVDPDVTNNPIAELGRTAAIASNELYGLYGTALPSGSVSYNAELVKQLSPKMQDVIKKYGTPISK